MQNSGINVFFQGVNTWRLLKGLCITISIAFLSMGISTVLGVLFGIMMTSKLRLIQFVSRLYLETVRIVPVLVLLFIFYFGVTRLFNIHLDGFAVSILVFSLWGTAEMGDVVRGAIESLPTHQRESAMAIGLNNKQVFQYVLIPQASRRIIPAAVNLMTRMIKTTSLVVLIGVVEVVKIGQQIIETNILKYPTASLWVYGLIFVMYFITCYPLSLLSKKLEKKWSN